MQDFRIFIVILWTATLRIKENKAYFLNIIHDIILTEISTFLGCFISIEISNRYVKVVYEVTVWW